MKYDLHISLYYEDGEERQWDWEETNMNQGTLEDAIISVMEGNTDTEELIFSVTRKGKD